MCSTGHSLSVNPQVRTCTGFHPRQEQFPFPEIARFRVAQTLRCLTTDRIESKRGFHPSALGIAWRALLEAPRFTVLTDLGRSATSHPRLGVCVCRVPDPLATDSIAEGVWRPPMQQKNIAEGAWRPPLATKNKHCSGGLAGPCDVAILPLISHYWNLFISSIILIVFFFLFGITHAQNPKDTLSRLVRFYQKDSPHAAPCRPCSNRS